MEVGQREREEEGLRRESELSRDPLRSGGLLVGKAVTALEALTSDEVNGWAGRNLDIYIHRPLNEQLARNLLATVLLTYESTT
jgi:hypothetical protein